MIVFLILFLIFVCLSAGFSIIIMNETAAKNDAIIAFVMQCLVVIISLIMVGYLFSKC